jgi:hypothetical protein
LGLIVTRLRLALDEFPGTGPRSSQRATIVIGGLAGRIAILILGCRMFSPIPGGIAETLFGWRIFALAIRE